MEGRAPFASYVIVFHQTNIKLNTKQTGPAQSFWGSQAKS
jgi:hypothetical protein